MNIKTQDGKYLVDCKVVTGFSNEEKLAKLDEYVPYLIETKLVNRGAKYQKAEQPFAPDAV